MRLLILAVALAAPASTPASPPAAAPQAIPAPRAPAVARALGDRECRRPEVVYTRGPIRPQAKSLGELPPGDLTLALYNEVDGCMEPVVVRYGVGGGRR